MRPVRCAISFSCLPNHAPFSRDVREHRRIGDALEHVIRHRRDERSAAERRAVIARLDRRRDLVRHQHRAHRQSAGDRLGEREHVRLDAELLVGEQRSRATEAALDLVEDQRDVALLRERAQLAHEAGVEHAHAALALHRLDDQRRDRLGVQRDREILDVALDDRDARRERTERHAIRRTIGRRERARTAGRETRRAAR